MLTKAFIRERKGLFGYPDQKRTYIRAEATQKTELYGIQQKQVNSENHLQHL